MRSDEFLQTTELLKSDYSAEDADNVFTFGQHEIPYSFLMRLIEELEWSSSVVKGLLESQEEAAKELLLLREEIRVLGLFNDGLLAEVMSKKKELETAKEDIARYRSQC